MSENGMKESDVEEAFNMIELAKLCSMENG